MGEFIKFLPILSYDGFSMRQMDAALNVKDFNLLVSLGLFNSAYMNGAVYNFKRYEDASLVYTGIDKHEGEKVGGWDTVVSKKEYDEIFENRAAR